ncbi:methyltransferase domain-containing protein [Stappia sp. GBMRC 2046]|uniref:Methyltransferase domain-containing protein n=1 Tax=Stappia sediminis TaxID=2692190 RepID=A0A7X3S8P4_9HYPH|nr:class I SAM-dependent methyltransferase [Stappia sediminis]MXN66043.1 methyltransferase domain-containing protein [Stappia sediminis]
MSAAAGSGVLMDRIYRHQRHIYDFTRKYYLLGRDRLIERLDPPPGGAVLEIGCGTGRNLIRAARMHEGVRFFGIDISSEMLETARAKIARAGLSGRIAVAQADAAAFDPEKLFKISAFDRVFLSYTLSMIPPWRQAIDMAFRCLDEDGRLSIVDFGQQERLPRIFCSALLAWLASFHVEPRAELHHVLKNAGARAGAGVSFTPLYRGYAWTAEAGFQAKANCQRVSIASTAEA